MKPLLFAFCFVFAFGGLSAQPPVWQPSPGHTQVPIWPGTAPDAQPVAGPEESHWWPPGPGGPGGFTVYHVSRPTMTVYSPEGKNTGAVVVVFPGGGYEDLAIDLEGTEACDWLTSKGITCVLLKYRVPNSGASWDQSCGCDRNTRSSRPLEDAQRTIGLVRLHAAERRIDPHNIGVLGFSAGGHMVAAHQIRGDRMADPGRDVARRYRHDFAMSLHPNEVARRSRMSSLALGLGFVLLIGAFFRTQVIQKKQYLTQSEENRLRPIPVP